MYSFHTWLQDLEDQVRDQDQILELYQGLDQDLDQEPDQDLDQEPDQILDQELDLNLDQGFVAEPQDELLCILFMGTSCWNPTIQS